MSSSGRSSSPDSDTSRVSIIPATPPQSFIVNWAKINKRRQPNVRTVPRYSTGVTRGEEVSDQDWAIIKGILDLVEQKADTATNYNLSKLNGFKKAYPTEFASMVAMLDGESSVVKSWFFCEDGWKADWVILSTLRKHRKKAYAPPQPVSHFLLALEDYSLILTLQNRYLQNASRHPALPSRPNHELPTRLYCQSSISP